MDIKYSFAKKGKLFIFRYAGIYSIDSHRVFSKFISQQPEWKNIEATLGDLRKSIIKISPAEVEEIVQIRNQYLSNGKVVAFLVAQPRTTAMTHLYRDKLSNLGTDSSYCSTIERAAHLLNVNISGAELTVALNQVDQTFNP